VQLRPCSDWILVRFDPPQKRSGIIELAGDNSTSPARTGTVVRTGPGKPKDSGGFAPMEVKENDRVVFLRWHEEHRPGKATSETLRKMADEIGEDLVLIRQNDVLFVFDGDITVDLP